MPTILVTGFRPYADEPRNPSGEIAGEIDGIEVGGFRIVTAILPVSRDQVLPRVATPIEMHRPEAVVALGLAPDRAVVTVEQVAVNVDDFSIPDELGDQPRGEPIVEGGPATLSAGLPVDLLVDAVRRAGLPARASWSAGTYVCNHLYYGLLHGVAADGAGPAFRSVFVHLPPLPDSVAALDNRRASMSLEGSRAAVLAIVGEVASYLTGGVRSDALPTETA